MPKLKVEFSAPGVSGFNLALAAVKLLQTNHDAVVTEVDRDNDGGLTFVMRMPGPSPWLFKVRERERRVGELHELVATQSERCGIIRDLVALQAERVRSQREWIALACKRLERIRQAGFAA
jgi:hypothetical protein